MKDKAVPIRMSSELRETLVRAARDSDISLAEFVRKSAEKAAKEAAEGKCKRCKGTGIEPEKKNLRERSTPG